MNTLRLQRPYVFRPPKYSPFLAPILIRLSDVFKLHRTFNVRKVTTEGIDKVVGLVKANHPVLVTPNHADRADPFVLTHIGNKYGLPFHFMAAREGFEQNRWLNSFVLQRCGAFSVDREGTDLAAIKTAMKILQDCRYPLVIFPEGEIYHHHECLAPLNEGVATILLRAAERLPQGKKSYIVPTAMRYTYSEDVVATFSPRLGGMEERIGWKPGEDIDVVDRIYRLGSGLLAIKEVEFLGHAQPGGLIERIGNLQHWLVERVEIKHFGKERSGSVPERVKLLRGKIRKVLTDPQAGISKEQEKGLYDDLDTLFLAVQLYSYPGQYLREKPTIHRIAETVLKLEEDVLGQATYPAPREVRVRFGEPIQVKQFLEERSLNVKTGVRPMTELLADTIQSLIESMPGSPMKEAVKG